MMAAMLTADTLLRRSPEVLAEQVGEATVVMDPVADRYTRLNATGGWLLDRLAEPVSPAQLARDLAGEHGLPPERALQDVLEFADDLLRRGLIELVALS